MELFHVEAWGQEIYTYVGEFTCKTIFLLLFLSVFAFYKPYSQKAYSWFLRKFLGTSGYQSRIYVDDLLGSCFRLLAVSLVSIPNLVLSTAFILLVWQQDLQLSIIATVSGSTGYILKVTILLSLWTLQYDLLGGFKYTLAQMIYRAISLIGFFTCTCTKLVASIDSEAIKTERAGLSLGVAVICLVVTSSILIFFFWLKPLGDLV